VFVVEKHVIIRTLFCRIVRVKLYQAFLLSGGPYGRLASGDELLLMEFSKAEGVEDVRIEALEPPASF
jgi:hypothetical protein